MESISLCSENRFLVCHCEPFALLLAQDELRVAISFSLLRVCFDYASQQPCPKSLDHTIMLKHINLELGKV